MKYDIEKAKIIGREWNAYGLRRIYFNILSLKEMGFDWAMSDYGYPLWAELNGERIERSDLNRLICGFDESVYLDLDKNRLVCNSVDLRNELQDFLELRN